MEGQLDEHMLSLILFYWFRISVTFLFRNVSTDLSLSLDNSPQCFTLMIDMIDISTAESPSIPNTQ